tara:strand:- start:12121 stop:13110 length:990 start_codon:yes stop_codon:yes gene_type:complete
MILIKTPLRISFFGGGTDLPEWLKNNRGAAINTTIDKYTFTTIRQIPSFYNINYRLRYYKHEQVINSSDIKHNSIREAVKLFDLKGPIEISHNSDLVAQSGLGSSSSFTVSLVHGISLIKKYTITKKNLAKNAIKIEQDLLKENVGNQDQISCSYGGFNYLSLQGKNFEVTPIKKNNNIKKIENSLVFIHCGVFRNADLIEKKKILKIKKGFKNSTLNQINQLTKEAYLELQSSNFSLSIWGKYLNEYWLLKKQLDKSVTMNKIENIHKKAIECGAFGGKLLGAGGGGFMVFICNSSSKKKIEKIFKRKILNNVKFCKMGSTALINNFS